MEAFPEAKVFKAGGSGFKVMQVIEGNHDVYIYPRLGTKKWDSCAPEAILRSVGGTLTDALGKDIDYAATEQRFHMNWTGLVASLSDKHDQFISLIPEQTKRSLQDEFFNKTQSKI